MDLSILLTVLFVALKLTEVIDWSWIWVVSPAWIGILIGFFILFVCVSKQHRDQKRFKW